MKKSFKIPLFIAVSFSFLPLSLSHKCLKVLGSSNTSTSVDLRLQILNISIDVIHKLNHKGHQLVLVHGLAVEVGDQKRNIIAGNGLAAQHEKVLSTLLQKRNKLADQHFLNLIGLLKKKKKKKKK